MACTRSNSAARTSATTISGYYFDASKAGQHYFNFIWDQTPHLYSTTAQTFYQGVGTTHLTLPPGYVPAATGANIVPFLYTTDIGIKRDTAAASYRWTPDDAWDIKADYSHLHRSGTQVDGVVGFGTSFGYGPTQVPRPVDDVTQNFGLNGEYVGTSPWGQRFNFKLAYNGSAIPTPSRPTRSRTRSLPENQGPSLRNRHGPATTPMASAGPWAPICRGIAVIPAR